MSALKQQARAALAIIKAAPLGVFVPSGERLARWSAGVSLLAQAVAVIAEVSVSGDADALESKGLLGDAALVIQAEEAASGLRGDLGQFAAFDARHFLAGTWGDMASGTYAGEEGQRQLIAIAAAIEERFPTLPPPGKPA